MAPDIHFIGLLRSPVSWAKVGRELIAALAAEGARVSAVSLKGYLYDDAFPLGEAVEAAIAAKRAEGWDLALDYPPNFARLTGRRRAGILIYEADRFPPHWAEATKLHLDLAIVPSQFCMEAAVASRVPREMLAIAPFGVNSQVYNPTASSGVRHPSPSVQVPSSSVQVPSPSVRVPSPSVQVPSPSVQTPSGDTRAFSLLTVAAPHVRKGLRETTEAFCRAFKPDDDIGLVIKCPPIKQLGRRPWEYRAIEDFLPPGREGQIRLVAQSYTEEEMAALYRAADVYVQASYGEGYGLALLEAAACGKPVITTGWGAAAAVFDASSAWLVDYDLVDASAFAYDWPAAGGTVRMARPRVAHLAETMRRAYEAREERAAKAQAAQEVAAGASWARSAKAILEHLSARAARA